MIGANHQGRLSCGFELRSGIQSNWLDECDGLTGESPSSRGGIVEEVLCPVNTEFSWRNDQPGRRFPHEKQAFSF